MPEVSGSSSVPFGDSLTREGRSEEDRALGVARKSRLTLVPCDAEPRHWKVYGYWREGYDYEPPCMYCVYADLSVRHDDLVHAGHKPWRRWKLTHSLLSWLYVMGVTRAGNSIQWSRTCNRCITAWPKFGRGHRVYILGVQTDTWSCLLRRHHFPGERIGFGLCTKCAPCPDCGNTSAVYHDCQRPSEASL